MAGEENRAQKRQPVAGVHRGQPLAAGAQKIKTHKRQNRADPVHELDTQLHEKPQKRNEDNVHCRDEAGFSDRGVDDAILLDDACRAQQRTADHAAQQLPLCRFSCRANGDSLFVAQRNNGQKNQTGKKISGCLHGKRSDIVHALALGDERCAPDHGAEQKHEAAAGLLFHGIVSLREKICTITA